MLVWSCIAPHGSEIIPDLAQGNLGRMAATRAAMEELGRRCRKAMPDTIVVFTPHGTQVQGFVTVSASPEAEGSLGAEDGSLVTARFAVDGELTAAIVTEGLNRGVSVLPLAFADEEHNPLPFQLDWGCLVPLWFMGAEWEPRPLVVVLCPSRALPRESLIECGRVVAEVAETSEKRVAIICSADQGHGHDAAGPYGFAAESAQYDLAYTTAVREDSLATLLEWDETWIGCAMTDSYWQTLMLHGALLQTQKRPELLSYEAPTYFGMACAAYERI